MFAAFGRRPVTVRTLDAGSDKPLAFIPQASEHNPALGRRGIRLSELQPKLLSTQLKALAAAASKTGATIKVMAPMVATRREARWFADRACSEGISSTGIMVEVPSAALRAHRLIAEVDFASIGTNDLAQYTMAADRLEGGLGDLLSPWQPALLDLIAVTADAGRQAGKPVGVCGEAAGDPLLALVLIGLGVSSLSMAANRVPAVRFAVARHDMATCQEIAAAARGEDGPAAARNAVRALCSAELDPLLEQLWNAGPRLA
jgi:phosphotransferase system enzyme I (PtsI)